jgi:hypothetical protein
MCVKFPSSYTGKSGPKSFIRVFGRAGRSVASAFLSALVPREIDFSRVDAIVTQPRLRAVNPPPERQISFRAAKTKMLSGSAARQRGHGYDGSRDRIPRASMPGAIPPGNN